MMCVGERIKEVRLNRSFSQKELAEKMGICRQTLLRLESGKKNRMTTDYLLKICMACNCKADYILGLSSVITELDEPQPREITNDLIGKRLMEVRKENGISQTAVAKKIDKKWISVICNWERGLHSIPADDLVKLCKVYNCDVNYILGLSKKKDNDIKETVTTLVRAFLFMDAKGKELLMSVASSESARSLAQGSNQIADTSNIGVRIIEKNELE